MEKTQLLLQDLEQAYKKLQEVETFPKEEVFRDAAIQRFEFTFELCWKLMQAIAFQNGLQESYGPRNSIRSAAQLQLIESTDKWFKALENRNLTTHLYRKELAEEIFKSIPGFTRLVKFFIEKVKENLSLTL